MKKWTFALTTVVATTALIAVGTLAQAVDPSSQTVEGGANFTVAFDCGTSPNSVNFSFEGVEQNNVPCEGDRDEAIGVFTAPAALETSRTYTTGTACLNVQTLRSGLRFTGEQPGCEEFTVTVLGVAPTTVAPTTVAPTTVAPTTTLAVGAVPPAPTTTVAIQLPETGPDRTDGGIVIALALLAIGGGLIVATRWRKDTTPS